MGKDNQKTSYSIYKGILTPQATTRFLPYTHVERIPLGIDLPYEGSGSQNIILYTYLVARQYTMNYLRKGIGLSRLVRYGVTLDTEQVDLPHSQKTKGCMNSTYGDTANC